MIFSGQRQQLFKSIAKSAALLAMVELMCVVALTVFEDVQLWLLARLYQQFEQLSIAQKGSGANCGPSARGRDVGGLGTLDDAVQRLTKITTVHGTQQTLVKVVGQHFSITIAVQLASNVDTKCIFYFVM